MAEKVKVWFDSESDYLEVQFREAPGFMRGTAQKTTRWKRNLLQVSNSVTAA